MDMYTRMVFHADLVYAEHVRMVQQVIDCAQLEIACRLPEHPFFDTFRWELIMSDAWMDGSRLHIDTAIKNYGQELQHFLSWIFPYILHTRHEIVGCLWHEGDDEPTYLTWPLIDFFPE